MSTGHAPQTRHWPRGTGATVLVAVVALCVGVALFTYGRMTATPALGAPPLGPAHGRTEPELALYAATQLVPLLRPGGAAHSTVVLSEQDLTVEVRRRATGALVNPEVRVRDGQLVISGRATVLGIGVVAVGRLHVQLTTAGDGLPDIAVTIDEIDAGDMSLPGFLRDAIATDIGRQVQLGSLLSADPRLRLLRGQLECVAPVTAGLVLGFHGPLSQADSTTCATA